MAYRLALALAAGIAYENANARQRWLRRGWRRQPRRSRIEMAAWPAIWLLALMKWPKPRLALYGSLALLRLASASYLSLFCAVSRSVSVYHLL